MLKKTIRIIGYSLLIIPLLILVDFNCAQHYTPTFKTTDSSIFNKDVYYQLQHLKEEFENGAAEEMQHIYPEGFIFFNALYALSWTEFIRSIPEGSDLHHEGLNEITKAWEAIDSENGKSIFNANLPLPYGAFYAGWNNYVLGSKLAIQSPAMRDSIEVRLFEQNCAIIAKLYSTSEYPFLESYGYGSWPADNAVAIASLALHDKILEPKYTKSIQDWVAKVKTHLDPSTGLIPHAVHTHQKKIDQGARGSSQSLLLNFLVEIDERFSREQFQLYKKHFLDKRLGLYGVREHPKGVNSSGDIDSGPVIWDIGGAASIVGQRAMWKNGAIEEAKSIRNNLESFGMTASFNEKKKYLLGALPIADAFLCWSNSVETIPTKASVSNSRLIIHFISILALLILGIIFKLITKITKTS